MGKTVNLTIRISPQLKAEAEMAAGYLDVTLSKVMRDALSELVDRAAEKYMRRDFVQKRMGEVGAGGQRVSMKDEVIASIRKRAADGLITLEEAEEKIRRLENPEHV